MDNSPFNHGRKRRNSTIKCSTYNIANEVDWWLIIIYSLFIYIRLGLPPTKKRVSTIWRAAGEPNPSLNPPPPPIPTPSPSSLALSQWVLHAGDKSLAIGNKCNTHFSKWLLRIYEEMCCKLRNGCYTFCNLQNMFQIAATAVSNFFATCNTAKKKTYKLRLLHSAVFIPTCHVQTFCCKKNGIVHVTAA